MTSKEKSYYYYDESDKPSNVGISGVRPRRLHQRISRNILYNLLQNISWSKYEPIMEASMDDEDTKAKSPDLMIINRKKGNIEIIFEICRTSQVNNDLNKVRDLLSDYQGIKEAFVYDYEAFKWYKITPQKEYQRECYISKTLKENMQDYIKIVRRGITL